MLALMEVLRTKVLRKWMMPNGLWVVHKHIPNNSLVAISVHVKGGAGVEKANEIGLAHFTEHMIFKASEKYPSEEIISSLIEFEGGETNAFTSNNSIVFFILTTRSVELMFDILSDGIKYPLFRPEDIDVERGAVFQEIANGDDDPDRMISKVYNQIIWGKHPFGRNIIGTVEQVSALKNDDFLNYHNGYFTAENMVLSVAGGISSGEILELAYKYFGNGLRKGMRVSLQEVDFSAKPQNKILFAEKNLTQFRGDFGSLPQDWLADKKHGEKERMAAVVLANILGGGLSSRLFIKVRSQLGLVYSISAGITSYENAGAFWIDFGCAPDNAVKASSVILNELDNLLKNGVSTEELQKIKNGIYTSLAKTQERAMSHAITNGRRELMAIEHTELEDYIRSFVNPITIADTMNAAERLFPRENIYFAATGKVECYAKELEALLLH